jgi:hypothetical protein
VVGREVMERLREPLGRSFLRLIPGFNLFWLISRTSTAFITRKKFLCNARSHTLCKPMAQVITSR